MPMSSELIAAKPLWSAPVFRRFGLRVQRGGSADGLEEAVATWKFKAAQQRRSPRRLRRGLRVPGLICSLVVFAGLLAVARADVARPAPQFVWLDDTGKARNLADFAAAKLAFERKGQPVVLIIAPSPRDWTFRSQVGQLQQAYQRFAAAKLVCFAAFTQAPGTIESNIPFVVTENAPRVAFDYGVEKKFAIAVIGIDGNLDCLSTKVLPAQRILDIMENSFVMQERLRKP
jgi:hypothetical protein